MIDNLTIIIPYCNGQDTIGRLLDSIPSDIPLLIMDDLSSKPLKHKSTVRLSEKGYFAGAVNAGIKTCKTDVLVLNQDSVLSDGWQKLLDNNRAEYAMIGERIAGDHPAFLHGYVQGTFMYMRRDAISQVGGLDAANFPLWGATADWQTRICRAGYKSLPLDHVPGYRHDRHGKYGSSITALLASQPDKRDLFVRTPPLVSVVIPCYNYGRFLPDAINSLIGGNTSIDIMPPQTFQAFEIIIVDDASTDNSRQIIQKLVDDWKGIRAVYHDRRLGTPSANNSGIAAAYGRAVTILSADDMMESARLETMYREWAKNPKSMIYDDLQLFAHGKRGVTWKMAEYDFDKLIYKNHIHAGVMFAREAWRKVGGYPAEAIYGREDWAFNIRMGLHGYCGKHIPEAGYLYRREGHNRTTRNVGAEWATFFAAQMKYLFPEAYGLGGKANPMACCGRGKTVKLSKVSQIALAQNTPLIGADGMTLLRYVGSSIGTQSFYGPVTAARYPFGLSRPTRYVDNRDLHTAKGTGLLDISENGKRIFVKEEGAPPPVPPVDKVVVNGGVVEESTSTMTVTSDIVDESGAVEMTDNGYAWLLAGTVADFKAGFYGLDLTAEDKAALYEIESVGKARTTILALLK